MWLRVPDNTSPKYMYEGRCMPKYEHLHIQLGHTSMWMRVPDKTYKDECKCMPFQTNAQAQRCDLVDSQLRESSEHEYEIEQK